MAAALPQVAVPALQYLSQLGTVNIKQTSAGYNGNNYTVLSEGDQVLFYMNEIVPDTFFRGGAKRGFKFDGVDCTGSKLFSFNRPIGTIFISDTVELFMNENLVSVVHNERTFLRAIFKITDALNNPVIRLKGHSSKYFQLQTITKTPIGAIEKKDGGWKKEFFSYKDDYNVQFPVDLAVPFKIAVIVACVYIDFTFHEGK